MARAFEAMQLRAACSIVRHSGPVGLIALPTA